MNSTRNHLRRLFKPEYVFQPRVALRRAAAMAGLASRPGGTTRRYVLPWGLALDVPADDDHSRMLETLGVVDLAVTEMLWRLTDPDDHVIDAGANIGYMTAVFLARISASRGGRVTAIEAHPDVRRDLERNLALWQSAGAAPVDAVWAAVSASDGSVSLAEPSAFDTNRGLARVVEPADAGAAQVVRSVTLDTLVPAPERVGVLKLDVEGHELAVLDGATRLLADGRLRDCVFEDHAPAPSAVMSRFIAAGFHVMRVDRALTGPVLLPAEAEGLTPWLPANYLATREPARALARCKGRGWRSLT